MKHEIGIIGGGPAGSTAAIYLARQGFDVCLFEKKEFPRETLCGEFLSKEVLDILKELSLFDSFLELNPNEMDGFSLYDNKGRSFSAGLGFKAFALKRSFFDNFLLTEARTKGITVYQPFEVKEVFRDSDSFIIRNDKNDDEIKVDILIAAYGKQSNLDKKIGRDFVNLKSKLNGIKYHIDKKYFNELNENEIQIYLSDGIYCGVNAVSADEVTVCFLEDRSDLNISPKKQLIRLRDENPGFKKSLDEKIVGDIDTLVPYGTGNIFFGKRKLVENGIFMIGDAARVIAPLAGDGIGMAMECGKLISEILFRQRKELLSLQETEKLYIEKWNSIFSIRTSYAIFSQKILLNSYDLFASSLLKIFPGMLGYLIRKTRHL